MDKLSDALFLLNPVAFRYKKEIDPKTERQHPRSLFSTRRSLPRKTQDSPFLLLRRQGPTAECLSVVHDKKGKPYTVRYDQVNAMLLNEFLKEHKEGAATGGRFGTAAQRLGIRTTKSRG